MAETTPDIADTTLQSTEQAPASPVEEKDQNDKKDMENSDGEAGERPVREKLKKTSIAGLSKQAEGSKGAEKTNGAQSQEETKPLDEGSTQRGRPTRKRSFEDVQEDAQAHQEAMNEAVSPSRNSAHKRMRSRDVTNTENISSNTRNHSKPEDPIREENQSPEETINTQTQPSSESKELGQVDSTQAATTAINGGEILSPKKKRSRDQFDKDYGTKEDNRSESSSERSIASGSDGPDGSDSALKSVPRTDAGEPEKKRHRDELLDRDRSLEKDQQTSMV